MLAQGFDRHLDDLVSETPGIRRGRRTAVTGEGIVVELVTAERPLVGYAFGGLALAGQLVALGRHPAEGLAMDLTVATHGHSAHVLRPAGDHDVGGAGGDGAGGKMHCHLARAAFAVDGQAGNGHRPAGAEQCGAGDVGRLLADLGDTAEDHVIDLRGRQIDALQQLADHQRTQMVGTHTGQAATEAADRRTHRINDHDVFHSALALSPEPGTRLPSS
ncbi:hypothetical protein D3C78_517660 [compost metagenome]